VVPALQPMILLFSGRSRRGPGPVQDPHPPPAPPAAPRPPPTPAAGLQAGAFVQLDRAIASRVESDDFSAAARELEKARPRYSEAAWSAGIEERLALLEAKARDALPRFLAPALSAQQEGRADEVERLRGFIAALPAVAAEFDRRLSEKPAPTPPAPPSPAPNPAPKPPPAPKPAPKPPTEEASYLVKWEKAMALRDPAAILVALEDVAKGLKTNEARAEASLDETLIKLAVPV